MAARKAAESDVDVLLVEKESGFGLKACGEAVSASTLADAEIEPSRKFISNFVRGTFVYAPNGKRVEISGEGYILEKDIFLKELASLAAKEGAEVWVESEVLDVEREPGGYRITLKKLGQTLSINARAVIGCDGVGSIVARKFFKRANYELIPCLQYKMIDCEFEDPHMTEVHLGNEIAPLGYAWIFPKNETAANVGIGVRNAPAKPHLDGFISNHPGNFKRAKVVRVQAAPVPIGGQIEQIVNESMMLCGDAAGQVMPLTGGGIHSSIVAGKIAGEVAGESLSKGDGFHAYPSRYVDWSDRIQKSLIALRLFEKLTDRDLNRLAEILSGEDIVNLANGLDIRKAGMKLLEDPHFAPRLGKILGE